MANWFRHFLSTPPDNPSSFDRFITGHWFWKWKLHRAEKSLAKALDESKSDPINLRIADLKFEESEFADIYGKPANPRIRAVVKVAHKSGVPLKDLWTLIINNDIRFDADKIYVRQNPWVSPLSWGMRLLVAAYIFCYSFSFFSASVPLWVKLIAEAFTFLAFGSILLFFEIFTARSQQSVKRTKIIIEAIAARLSSKSNVIEFRMQ